MPTLYIPRVAGSLNHLPASDGPCRPKNPLHPGQIYVEPGTQIVAGLLGNKAVRCPDRLVSVVFEWFYRGFPSNSMPKRERAPTQGDVADESGVAGRCTGLYGWLYSWSRCWHALKCIRRTSRNCWTRRSLHNSRVEQRYFTDWYPFRLLRVGYAAFVDAGRTWGEDPRTSPSLGMLYDIGFGVRLSSPRSSSGSVVHIDFAVPLNGESSISGLQVSVRTRASF